MLRMSEPSAPFNRVADCRHGRMIYNANDIIIGRSLEVYGEFSEGEVEVFRHFVRPGDIVLEVGANIGSHTLPLSKLVGEKGSVFAFEPQRLIFQTLCGNVALNSLSNVWTLQGVVGTGEGEVRVPEVNPRAPANFGGLELGGMLTGMQTPVIALDEIPVSRCRLIKIDVEGMELDVVRGAEGLIQRFRPILYLENDRDDKSDALIAHLRSLGYQLFWHTPPLFSLNNFRRNLHNLFGAVASVNMICVPAEWTGAMDGAQFTTPARTWTPGSVG